MKNERWLDKEINEVVREIFNSKDISGLKKILSHTLTKRETNDMARRYAILKKLKEGKSYSEIRQELGVSYSLIARVSVGMGYGFLRRTPDPALKKSEHKERPKKKTISYKGAPAFKIPR